MTDLAERKNWTGNLPWTRSCLVCGEDNPRGLRLRSRLEKGVVCLEYTTCASDVGYRDIVHGGIAITLLDEVMAWACIVATGRLCVAAEVSFRLKRPIAVNQRIRAEAALPAVHSRLLAVEGRLVDEAGHPLVVGNSKFVPMPGEAAALRVTDFVASPDTIPAERILLPG